MASIFERKLKNGSTTYRVVIRRKDIPLLCITFATKKEAKDWIKKNEEAYIEDPESYQKWISKDRLFLERTREFRRNRFLDV